MTVEFPNDNPDLWSHRAPLAALAILLAEAELAEEEIEAERSDPNDRVDFRRSEATSEGDDGPEVEVIEFDEADFAVVENESIPPPPKPDLFQVFARTLIEVALAAGAPGRVVEALPGMLGIARLDASVLGAEAIDALVAANMLARSESGAVVRSDDFVSAAQAWRATILGEEADFSACTSTLDEWSANLVATLANMPQQRETFRRDLRSRGVAAFGLLVEAA